MDYEKIEFLHKVKEWYTDGSFPGIIQSEDGLELDEIADHEIMREGKGSEYTNLINLIGKETIFKFTLCHDSCFYFKTLVPKSTNEILHYFEIMIYGDDAPCLHEFMPLKDIISNSQLGEVNKKDLDGTSEQIYFSQYKQNKQ